MKTLITIFFIIFSIHYCYADIQNNNYEIDENHTSVTFEILHFNTSTVRGRFNSKEGVIFYDKKNQQLKFNVVVNVSSIDSGIPAFNKHLKSIDFFNMEKFKKIKLKSKKALFRSGKLDSIEATLIMLGKEGSVVVRPTRFGCYINPRLKKEVCGGDFIFDIDRSKWGMIYGIPAIPETVRIVIQIEAVKTDS
jgi:polyisoprenoid-binding protein YceI